MALLAMFFAHIFAEPTFAFVQNMDGSVQILAANGFVILANNLPQGIQQSPILGPYRRCGIHFFPFLVFFLTPPVPP